MTTPKTLNEMYPADAKVGYHDAHAAYLDAVADALRGAGFEPTDWWADPNDPRDGWIEIRPVGVYADFDEVGLGWSEDRGWHVLAVDKRRAGMREDARYVFDVTPSRIPSPQTVVAEFAAMAGVEVEVPADDHPDADFLHHTFEDDDIEFEQALAHYQKATA